MLPIFTKLPSLIYWKVENPKHFKPEVFPCVAFEDGKEHFYIFPEIEYPGLLKVTRLSITLPVSIVNCHAGIPSHVSWHRGWWSWWGRGWTRVSGEGGPLHQNLPQRSRYNTSHLWALCLLCKICCSKKIYSVKCILFGQLVNYFLLRRWLMAEFPLSTMYLYIQTLCLQLACQVISLYTTWLYCSLLF